MRLLSDDFLWVESAENLERATARLTELASAKPADYLLFDTESSGFLKPLNDGGEH
jgi:hypothetical protein